MGQAPPAQTSRTTGQGATYHRSPPCAPEGSRVIHLVPGAILLGAAAALWERGEALPARWDVPRDAQLAVAGVLAVLGAVFVAQGLAALWRWSRRGRGARFHPAGPWKSEWPWNPEGVDDALAVRIRERFAGFGVIVAATAPAGVFLWAEDLHRNRTIAVIFLLPAALLLLEALAATVYRAFRGRGRLEFHAYPFPVGGTLQARYVPPGRVLALGPRMRATLRCLEVEGKASGGRVTVREKWKWTEDEEVIGGVVEIVIEVTAPVGLATTFGRTTRFWELEVGPWTVGDAANAKFVVPIYVDPALRIPEPTPAPAAPPAPRPSTSPPTASAPAAPARRPASNPPVRKPATVPPANAPKPPSAPPARKPASNPPVRHATTNPPVGARRAEAAGEWFRCELLLTPALSPQELFSRVAIAFDVPLEPLPNADAGSYYGRIPGLDVTLSAGPENRRLLIGGTRPIDPGPGDLTDRASEWAIAKLLTAGVAARRPA